jgi:hypothetical protein
MAEAFATAEIHGTALVEAHDRIDSPAQERGDRKVGTEAAIGEQNIPRSQVIPEGAQELALMEAKAAASELQQRSAG